MSADMLTNEEATQAYEGLVHHLVKPLLGDTEYTLRSKVNGGELALLLDAPPAARGRVIGRGGRIARSLRTIVEAANISSPLRVSFDIVD